MTGQGKPKILMVTAVWGDWHIDAHLRCNLPTLMAPRNLPELARRCDVTYRVYTLRSDVGRITTAPILTDVSRIVRLEVATFGAARVANPIAAHQSAWASAAGDARDNGQFALLLPPDVAWSNGSFAYLAELLEAGKKAVFMTYLRVVSDTFVPDLARHDQRNIALDGSELVSLALHHLHPLMAAYGHDSPYFPLHREMVLWPVRGEGVLARVLAREMFLYDPRRIATTSQWLMDGPVDPAEVVFVNDSDQLFAVSLAPLGKDAAWHTEYRRATPLTLARWWLDYDSPANDFVAGTRVRWHAQTPTPTAWQRQERRSDRLIQDAIAAREGLRLWRQLEAMGCTRAASLLAVCVGAGFLRRVIGTSRPAVVLAPTDEALGRIPHAAWRDLATAGNRGRLTAFLRQHVVFTDDPPTDASALGGLRGPDGRPPTSAAGSPLSMRGSGDRPTVNGIPVGAVGKRAGRYVVFSIDGVLDPALSPSRPVGTAAAP